MPPRKRRRNYSAEYRRRNELAKGRGYKDYYDYRAHAYGKRRPSEPKLTGAALRKLRGHATGTDLDRLVKSGRVEFLHVFHKQKDPPEFEAVAVLDNDDERTFYLRGASLRRVQITIAALGPDAPTVVGSKKAVQAFTEGD